MRAMKWGKVSGAKRVTGDVMVWGHIDRISAGDLRTGSLLWTIDTSGDSKTCGTGTFAVAPETTVFAMRSGDVVGVTTKDGEERWRASVRDLKPPTEIEETVHGEVRGAMHVFEDSIIVNVSGAFLVSLSLKDGKRRWVREMSVVETVLEGGHIVEVPNTVFSAKTGRLISDRWEGWPEELKAKGIWITRGFTLSETHGFSCTNNGDIVSWERKSGRVVWRYRPPGACGGFDVKLKITDGRLYWADSSNRLYCLEEVEPTDPVLKSDREALRAAGTPFKFPRVPFELKEPRGPMKTKSTRR